MNSAPDRRRSLVKVAAQPRPSMRRAVVSFGLLAVLVIGLAQGLRAQGLPVGFADLVDRVTPAVVNIETLIAVDKRLGQGPDLPADSPLKDLLDQFGPDTPGGPDGQPAPEDGPPLGERAQALGAGFVISPDGLIVTNNHVIANSDRITVQFFSGEVLDAKLLGTDELADIALLKVESDKPLPYLNFGDSDKARVGDWVLAIGNPLGQGFSVSLGIISARNRDLEDNGAFNPTHNSMFQTDAAINQGNSGGPLINMDGEVIGVNTAILSQTGGSVGIGLSRVSNLVSALVKQLEKYGEARRGWLGVKIQDVTPDMVEAMGLASAQGALVNDVPDGPAKNAGILAGDIITSVAGIAVADSSGLLSVVSQTDAGTEVDVIVLRKDASDTYQPVTIKVKLGIRTKSGGETEIGTGDAPVESVTPVDLLGMTVQGITDDLRGEYKLDVDIKGVVITKVEPGSAAELKGLMPGDVITEAGQVPVTSVSDLQAQVKESQEAGRKSILLLLRGAAGPRFVALPVE